MMIAATSSFTLGKFTVQQRPRQDNPAFAVFLVFLGAKFLGKQFSMPSVSDCESLGREYKPALPLAIRMRYGRKTAFPVSVCSRCGSPFAGLSGVCVPCKEGAGR